MSSYKKIILYASIFGIFLLPAVLSQVQNHPLSQVLIDRELNLTGVNMTNVTYIFFGNNSNDVNLYREGANILKTDDSFSVAGSWLNISGSIGPARNIPFAGGISFTASNFSIGSGAVTLSSGAIAIGDSAVSSDSSVVIGPSASVDGSTDTAVVIGSGATVESNSDRAIAIGRDAVSSQFSIVIGANANSGSSTDNVIAIGRSATAKSNADDSMVIGQQAIAGVNTDFGIAIGHFAGTFADNGTAIGRFTNATAVNAMVLGIGHDAGTTSALTNNLANTFMVGYGTTPMLLINFSNGNVGVGTTSPNSRLTLFNGDLNASGNNITGLNYVLFGNGTDDVTLYRSSSNILKTDDDLVVGGNWLNVSRLNVSTSAAIAGLDFTGDIDLNNNDIIDAVWVNASYLNASAGFIVTPSGNVGIGTLSPASLLHVVGTGNTLNISNSTLSQLFVDSTLGRVGIMTTSPDNSLEVNSTQGVPLKVSTRAASVGIEYEVRGTVEWQTYANVDTFNFYDGAQSIMTISQGAPVSSLYINSAGRVGLGTATPSTSLDVLGGINASNANFTGSAGLVFNITNTGSGDSFRVNDAAGDTTPFIIDSAGNVGIGTTTLLSTLELSGNLSVSGSTNSSIDGSTFFVDATNNRIGMGTKSPGYTFEVSGNISTTASASSVIRSSAFVSNIGGQLASFGSTDGGFYFIDNGNGAISFVTAGADRMILDSSGRLGINTTSPSSLLHVNGSALGNVSLPSISSNTDFIISDIGAPGNHAYMSLLSDNTSGVSQIQFGDSDDEDIGRIRYTHSNDVMGFFTNNAEAMRIGNNQRIGIGTNSPTALLHINGTGNLLNVSNMTHSFLFVEQTNGRVGIGTSSPQRPLHVTGITEITALSSAHSQLLLTTATNGFDSKIIFRDESSVNRWNVGYDDTDGHLKFSEGNDGALPNVTRVTFGAGGNVGIGTDSPASLLHLNGTGALLNVTNNTVPIFFANNTAPGYVGTSTNSRFCLDGAVCSRYITYNGTHTIIN